MEKVFLIIAILLLIFLIWVLCKAASMNDADEQWVKHYLDREHPSNETTENGVTYNKDNEK